MTGLRGGLAQDESSEIGFGADDEGVGQEALGQLALAVAGRLVRSSPTKLQPRQQRHAGG